MKNLASKIPIAVFIISIIAITFSCKKNVGVLEAEKKIATVNNLSTSSSFVNYVANLDNIINHLKNSRNLNSSEKSQLKNYLSSNPLSKKELMLVANYSGFDSLSEFIEVLNQQDNLIKDIKQEFKEITKVPEDSLYEAILLVHKMNVSKYKITQLSPEELCRRIYNNCTSRASANYTTAVVGCTVSAIGVGAATFLAGGVVYQIGCGGLAYWYLSLQRDECGLNYETCVKK